eukprot:scaffold272619_cov33-Tisochrysis_lutea.AAC.1
MMYNPNAVRKVPSTTPGIRRRERAKSAFGFSTSIVMERRGEGSDEAYASALPSPSDAGGAWCERDGSHKPPTHP